MKNFKAYLSEAAYISQNPATGDYFDIQLTSTESVQTYVLEHTMGSVTLAADHALFKILSESGLLESTQSPHQQANGDRSEDNDLEENQYGDYDDEDEDEGADQNSDQGFYVVIASEDSEPFVGMVTKDGGKWREVGGTGNQPSNWGNTYMSYLEPTEVMQWIRQDYGRHAEVAGPFFDENKAHDHANMMSEAEYQGRKVTLNKPMAGDVKKSKVYVKDPSTGNVKKVNFGDPNMKIKKSNPARRKSFRARHNCANPGPKTKARYWSCRAW
jgi:hypothetical protein